MTSPDSPNSSSELDEAIAMCAVEPIHTPGGIQSFGTLLAIGPDGAVAYCGANVAEYLGLGTDELIGRPLIAVLPQATRALDELSDGPARHFGTVILPASGPVELYAHRHAGVRFVELVRTAAPDGDRPLEGRLASALADLAPQLEDECTPRGFAGHVVEQARALTGYDWIMVYQFDDLWNGEVIAEERPTHPEQFLGLWFPPSDIPAQARDLYLRVRTRVLMDARAAPVPVVGPGGAAARDLDLSFAVLRAVSPVHREYLGNMGVRATLVASVVVRGQLWGLLVCHHPAPHVPSPAAVQLLGVLARFLASKVTLTEERERVHGKALAQRLLATLPRDEARRRDLVASLTAPPLGLMELMRADGLLVTHRGRGESRGLLPPTDFVRRLVDWLDARDDELFATDRLGEVAPALAGQGTAAGVLALRIPNLSQGWILWFRPEAARVVRWGGDPTKGLVRVGGAPRLTPRASFEAWRTEIRGRSMAWSRVELGMAEDVIRHNLVEALARSFQRQAEEFSRYHAILFEQVSDAVVVTDPSGTITFWNAGAARTLGWSPREMVGRPILERLPADDRATAADRFARALAGEEITGTFADTHKDGRRVWLDVRLRRVEDENGEALGAMAVSRDVTVQRELEEKLRLSDAIIRHAQDSILVTEAASIDEPGPRIVFANPSFLAETGYALDEVLGTSPRFLQGPMSAREPLDRIRVALLRGEEVRVELTNYRKDGTPRAVDLEINPLTDATGRVTHFFSIQRDVSAQKATENALRQSEERLQMALRNSQQGTWDWNVATGRAEFDEYWHAILGYAPNELPDRIATWEQTVHPDDRERVMAVLARHFAGEGTMFDVEYRGLTKSGGWVWINARGRVQERADDGTVVRMLGTVQDVTQRKWAEERLLASIREKEVLLKEIHHRVKNNLQIVSALLDLQSAQTTDVKSWEMFQESRGRVRSMALIHERLYRSEDVTRVDFEQYLRHLTSDLYYTYNVSIDRVQLELDLDIPPMSIDIAIPCGLLVNELISNCFKHAFAPAADGRLQVRARRAADGTNLVAVSDDGVGFPPETDFRNTASFGLQLVNTLVKQLHGEIEMTTGPGTTFTVRFPKAKAQPPVRNPHP